MKLFYPIAILIIAVLTLFPLVLLSKDTAENHGTNTVYRRTYPADVKSIDPATCGDDISSIIQANFYEGLYSYHYLKRPVEVVPQLAAAMPEISPDGLTYTIHLKAGVLYHRNPCFGKDSTGRHLWNTRTMTAADFVLAFKRIADYHINTGLAWAFIAGRIDGLDDFREKTRLYRIGDFSRYDLPVKGLEAPDSLTLRFRLVKPFPQFIYIIAMQTCAPIPHELVDYWLTTENDGHGGRRFLPVHERNPEITEPSSAVGTGPYLLDLMKRKWKIRLVRNPDFRPDFYPCEGQPASPSYAGDSALGLLTDCGVRVPIIDEIDFRYVDEQYTSWMMFLSKQADVAGIPREAFQNVVRPDKNLTDAWEKQHIRLMRATEPAIYWTVFNMEDPVVGRCKAMRQAISLGFDAESEIEILLNGRARRAVNTVPADFKGHEEAGPSPYAHYDLVAAREKIAQAKAELKAAGLLVKGEIPELKIDLSDGPDAIKEAEFARQQFANLGLRIKTVFNDWPTLQRKVNNKQSQMYMMGWVADYPDAEDFLQLYYSGNIDKGTNNSNYHNPVFDSLYERVRVMQDSPERTALYAKMIRIISEDCPVLFKYEPENFVLIHDWDHPMKQHPIGYGFFKYHSIDVAQRAREGGGS